MPVLPRLQTALKAPGSGLNVPGGGSGVSAPAILRPAHESDYAALLALYDHQLAIYPCAVARSVDPWLWETRSTGMSTLLASPDRRAYALVTIPPAGDQLYVPEAALSLDGSLVLQAGYAALTQLILGYRSLDELLSTLDGGAGTPTAPAATTGPVATIAPVTAVAEGAILSRLRRDFPPAFPKWSPAPFWH